MADNEIKPAVPIYESGERSESGAAEKLNRKNIRNHNYTITLLSEAIRIGKINGQESDRIRVGITDALENSVVVFTGGDSTSVMAETANSLLRSVLFAVDAYLLSLKNDYKAIEELKAHSITHLYELGMKRLKLMIYETMSLLAKCRSNRIDTPNSRYNDTIDRQITGFLRTYNIATNAHISSSFTYKPMLPLENLNGIYKIKTAAYYLSCENSFCSAYGGSEISAVYRRWCDQNDETYTDAKVNIYELVFTCALFCDYLKKEHGTLSLSRADCDLVCRLLEDFDDEKIREILESTASHLIYGEKEYNSRALAMMLPRLVRVIKSGALVNAIPIET